VSDNAEGISMSEGAPPKGPTTITRDELYRRVWETPMSKLAKEFGLSDVGLAKTCKRLDIPYPPRGWWARKAAGQKLVQPKLPKWDDGDQVAFEIWPTPAPTPAPTAPPEVQEKIETAVAAVTSIVVSEKLSKPHAIVAKWIADHEKSQDEAKAQRRRYGGHWPVPADLTPTDRRQYRIFDAVLKTLEKLGGKVALDDRADVSVTLSGEKIAFRIIEKQKQVRTPREDGSGSRQELVPTGKLLFKFERYLPDGFRKEWLETDQRSMDEMLPEIVGHIVTVAPILAEQTRQSAENERRRREAERQREEEEQRRKTGANQWRRFIEIAKMWENAKLATAFVEELRKQEFEPGTKVGDKTIEEWLVWAEDYANYPLDAGLEAIFEDVNSKNAWSYNETSHHHGSAGYGDVERAFWAGRNSFRRG
jgi:hypothetical protein